MKIVSIIIPVYGVEKYIEKCARTIFEQTYPYLDIIFVNDCTPDKSISILENLILEYPQRKDNVRIISNEKNKGLAGSRKVGIQHAVGDYLLQIDSDDYIRTDMVELMMKKVEAEAADIVICDLNYVWKDRIVHEKVAPSLNSHQCMKQILSGVVHGSVANKLIKKDLYLSNDIWPIEGLDNREDLSVCYRLFYFASKISFIPEALYFYIQRGDSITATRMGEKEQRNASDLIRNMDDFCKRNQIIDKDIIDAFNYFKADMHTLMLLRGNLARINSDLFRTLHLRHYIFHPTIRFYYKIVGVLYVCKCTFLIKLVRYLFNLALKVR